MLACGANARSEDASSAGPAFVGVTSPRKNASSKRCDVLQRIDDREARLGAEQERRVAVRQVQVHEQRLRRRQLRQRGGHVDGGRRRAHAALGADDREHLAAAGGRRAMRDEAGDGLLERGRGDRLLQELGGPGAHRFEQHGRVRLRGDDQKAHARMLALDRRHRRRDRACAARVHDDDVGQLRGRVHQGGELRRARSRRAHAARAQELLQLAIERVDDEDVRNQIG